MLGLACGNGYARGIRGTSVKAGLGKKQSYLKTKAKRFEAWLK
jgi:hypothetical protein